MKDLKKQLEERLKTIEDCFSETGRPQVDFSVYPEDLRVNREAEYHALVIVEAARKIEREHGLGEIDWNDCNQQKWRNWFCLDHDSAAGFRFDGSSYAYSRAHAGCGSRLHVLSETASDYIAVQFLDVWRKVQLE